MSPSRQRPKCRFEHVRAAVALAASLMGCSSADLIAIGPPLSEAGPDAGAIEEGGAPAPDASTLMPDAGTSISSRKRGIAYGYHSDADLRAIAKGIGWWYNWSPHADDSLSMSYAALGVDFVPMVWGGTFTINDLNQQIPNGAGYLLAFNEPNFGNQANLTPEAAAALWPKLEEIAQQRGMKLVSPAVNYCGGNCNETDPFVWMDKFFAACTGCQVDYVAVHWYACSKDALVGHLDKYKSKYNKPLWLTEFSCLDDSAITEEKEEQYMQDALGVLEADPLVFRYSWFTGRFSSQPAVNLLGQGGGELTKLGQSYIAYPSAAQ